MTNEATGPNKAELIANLTSSGEDIVRRVRALSPQALEEGRYENGWNGRQILAHIASIEWTYARLPDIAKDADAPKPEATSREKPSDPPTRAARGGILSYNDRQVEKRADASIADLLDEFERNRAATIAAVEATDEALFSREIKSAGGITGTLGFVMNAVCVLHVLAHANDIEGK
jgi:hypothetical protein